MPAIQPCPFCGSSDVGLDVADILSSWVRCNACEAMGPSGQGADQAITRWNTRVPQEVPCPSS